MKRTNFILFFGGLLLVSALYTLTGVAQTAKSINDGIFTADQVKRGDVLYKEQCATCHGDNLEGSGPMPPLAGMDFLANWTGKTVGELFEKTHTTMPATAPGTLTPAQAADLVAHLLNASGYPAGATELEGKVETLLAIKIDGPKGAATAAAAAAATSNDGIFTAAQAQRGDVLYKEQCATCHGDNLEGSGPMPPLAGTDFLANWTGKAVGELFEKTHTTMPATAPGTLTPMQAADLTAHLLKASGFPVGTTELEGKVETLLTIRIEAPKLAAAPTAPAAPAVPTAPTVPAPTTPAVPGR
jgi:mono/diheme cytochrome c family protein